MIGVKVLGTGCANCKTTQKLIEDVTSENGIAIELEKIEDMTKIMSYGIMSTPGVIVDGKRLCNDSLDSILPVPLFTLLV